VSAEANAASRQGMLFGDPLEGIETDEVGYRGPIACSAAGITYRQLDYWARTGLLQPSIRAARGSYLVARRRCRILEGVYPVLYRFLTGRYEGHLTRRDSLGRLGQ